MTLTEFLLARIAEDEEVARNATVGPWWYDPSKMNAVDHEESVFAGSRGPSAITVASTGPCDDIGSMADAAHIARHDPARVLAECEAKRRIVEEHRTVAYEDAEMNDVGTGCYTCGFADEECETLLILATIYADHPDYDESWRL
jgi:hypothetical protein